MSAPARVRMYSSNFCPFCFRAKALLDSKGVEIEVLDVDRDLELRQQMQTLSGRHTVPQIFIGDQHVGGCDDLYTLEHQQRLDALLAGSA